MSNKVDFKDVYELLSEDLVFYSREIVRGKERHYSNEMIWFLKGQKRAIEMAMERLDLELNYGLGRVDDQ